MEKHVNILFKLRHKIVLTLQQKLHVVLALFHGQILNLTLYIKLKLVLFQRFPLSEETMLSLPLCWYFHTNDELDINWL